MRGLLYDRRARDASSRLLTLGLLSVPQLSHSSLHRSVKSSEGMRVAVTPDGQAPIPQRGRGRRFGFAGRDFERGEGSRQIFGSQAAPRRGPVLGGQVNTRNVTFE